MRKTILVSMIICGLLVFASSAWSLSITVDGGATDVGSLDTRVAAGDLKNSGDETELAWVKLELGRPDIVMEEKYDNVASNWKWKQTNIEGTWALKLLGTPEYFLIKTGKVDTGNNHFLFKNNAEMTWAVVNLSDVDISDVTAIGKLSHVDEFNNTQVPEPATLLLFGLGLLGLAGVRRKLKK